MLVSIRYVRLVRIIQIRFLSYRLQTKKSSDFKVILLDYKKLSNIKRVFCSAATHNSTKFNKYASEFFLMHLHDEIFFREIKFLSKPDQPLIKLYAN